MFAAEEWIRTYAAATQSLSEALDAMAADDVGSALDQLEQDIEVRQGLLDQLAETPLNQEEARLCRAYLDGIHEDEAHIRQRISLLQAVIEKGQRDIKEQRFALNRQSKANRSYAGSSVSSEGYFIDRRK